MNLELNEEYGAGFEGTPQLLYKYLKDTPGQSIQQFKNEMKEKTYKTYQEFEAQHKKMYPNHTVAQVQAAWEKYSEYFKMEEAYGESWVVYDKNKNIEIKRFKTRKGAQDYSMKSGGAVYSAEYYADNQDAIKSGKLVKEEAMNEDINWDLIKSMYMKDLIDYVVVPFAVAGVALSIRGVFAAKEKIKDWIAGRKDAADAKFVGKLIKDAIEKIKKDSTAQDMIAKINAVPYDRNSNNTERTKLIKPYKAHLKSILSAEQYEVLDDIYFASLKEDALQEAVPAIDIEELLDAAAKMRKEFPQLRKGQSIMLTLHNMNPTLYSMAAAKHDAFTVDAKIPDLINFLDPKYYAESSNIEEVISPATMGTATITSPGNILNGKTANIFHKFPDGRINVQYRKSTKKGDVINLTLKKGEYKLDEAFCLETARKIKIVALATDSCDLERIHEFVSRNPNMESIVTLKENYNKYIQSL